MVNIPPISTKKTPLTSNNINKKPKGWSYGSWIYNYKCNQCLSPQSCEFESRWWRGILDTALFDKVCQWFATGQWFSPVSSTNKTDSHDI